MLDTAYVGSISNDLYISITQSIMLQRYRLNRNLDPVIYSMVAVVDDQHSL